MRKDVRTPRTEVNCVSHLSRIISGLVVAFLLTAALGITTVRADRAYHTERLPISASGLPGHPELRTGAVVNIHAEGPVVWAIEEYMVNGAAPDTTYWVVIEVTVNGDCSEGPDAQLPTVPLVTDARGNARGMATFAPEDVAEFPKIPVHGRWSLRLDSPNGPEAYGTACTLVVID